MPINWTLPIIGPQTVHVFECCFICVLSEQESKTLRVNDIHCIIHQLPEPNFEMLDLIIGHLNRSVHTSCDQFTCHVISSHVM